MNIKEYKGGSKMTKATLRKVFKTIESIASKMDEDTFNYLGKEDINHIIGELECSYGEKGTTLKTVLTTLLVAVDDVINY